MKACTVCTASSASEPLPELSAIRSWFSRLSARSRRPSVMIGISTAGTISRTSPVSFGEVQISSPIPPTSSSTLRSAIETELPITDSSNVVSVVIRLSTSPVMIRS